MTDSTDKTMIQIQDEPDGDATVHLIASNNNLQAPILSFVISSTTEATYFGQLNSPAMWLNRTAQKRFDPAAIESLHRIERNEMNNSAFFRLSQYHRANLLVERRESVLSAPMTRPPSGSRWQIASAAEVSEFMQLPPTGHSIGHIAGIKTREGGKIEMRLTGEILSHHMLSAGQTGSGKSNTNVNIIGAAQATGFCSLVYDMKPDYSEIDQPNDEPLPPGVMPEGFRNVTYWVLGSDQIRPNETAISVPACELDPSKLAQVIFYRPGEDNQ